MYVGHALSPPLQPVQVYTVISPFPYYMNHVCDLRYFLLHTGTPSLLFLFS